MCMMVNLGWWYKARYVNCHNITLLIINKLYDYESQISR